MEKHAHSFFQRFFALLLCVAMLVSTALVPVSASEVTEPAATASTETDPTEGLAEGTGESTGETASEGNDLSTRIGDEEPLEVIWVASDFQKASKQESSETMMAIVNAMVANGVDNVTGAIFLGDYDAGYGVNDAEPWIRSNEGIYEIWKNLNSTWNLTYDDIIFLQGNHEAAYWELNRYNKEATGTEEDYKAVSGIQHLAASGNNDQTNYGVFVINEVDYAWDNIGGVTAVSKTAAKLESYLQTKVNQSYDKPIFIAAHLPLHYSQRTVVSGDAFCGELLFDVINKYGAMGLNIIYLFGHDHNHGFANYLGGDAIYLTKEDTMLLADTDDTSRKTYYTSEPLTFTYLNGGFLGKINESTTAAQEGVSNQNTSTIYEIYSDRVEITRYDASGVYNLKNAGSSNQEYAESYEPNTKVVESPQTVELEQFGFGLELGSLETGVMVVGDTGTVRLVINDGQTYEATWTTSAPEVASVTGSGMEAVVTALTPGTATITVTPTVVSRAVESLSFQVTVLSDEQTPGGLVTLVTEGETIYMRQHPLWDNHFVYDNYLYFSTIDDNPVLLVAEDKGYGESAGSRLIFGQTSISHETYYNAEGVSAEVTGYALDSMEFPFIKASAVPSNYFLWNITKQEHSVSGFGTPFTITNQATDNYLYVTVDDTNQYGQDAYGFRLKSSAANGVYGGAWWRLADDGRGIYSAKGTEDAHSLYTLYYSESRSHFAVSTEANLTNRIYIYYLANAPETITAQVDDTIGYVCKDAPVAVPTGDNVVMTSGETVSNIPITVDMLSGYYDLNTPGTYSGLKVVSSGVTISENYTLVVRDSATLMVSDGDSETNSSIYRLATSITEGKKYMIVDANTPGAAHALGYVENDDGGDGTLDTTTEAYTVVVEEWTIDGVKDMYIDASNWDGVNHSTHFRMAWYARKTFDYISATDGTAKTANALDGYYYFVNANSGHGLMDGRTVTLSQEPYNFAWGADYDAYGLYNNYENQYLAYDITQADIAKFHVREANSAARVYLYEQITSFCVASGYLSDHTGYVKTDAIGSTQTGDMLIIETITYDGNISTVRIPVTIDMLNATKDQVTTPGTYSGLTVTYNGIVICDDYMLNVSKTVINDYPEFPKEGAVRIGKNLDTSRYNYLETGAGSIELTVTGIPQSSGADIIIVLDTSSSMNVDIYGVGKTRMELLHEALKKLMIQLKTAVNGEPQDIDIAIVDFNGYTPISNEYTFEQFTYDTVEDGVAYTGRVSGNSPAAFGNEDKSQVYLNFTNLSEMSEAQIDTVITSITSKSGTNYDRGLHLAYDMLSAKQKENALNNERRKPYVVFMSDGAPGQFNYILCNSHGLFMEDYLLGTLDEVIAGTSESVQEQQFIDTGITYSGIGDMFSEAAQTVLDEFYNPDGKHWMAEAIKGDPNTKYKVIDPDIVNVDADCITEVNGLGATMISIGLGLKYDGAIEAEDCKNVLRNIASSDEYFYDITEASQLQGAFEQFASLIKSADNAVFTDQMGEAFDLITYNKRTFTTNDGTTKTITYNPIVQLKQYQLYHRSEIGSTVDDVVVTESMVGNRKPVEPVVLETVVFNDDGTAAYSTHVDRDGDGNYGVVRNADGSFSINDEADNILIDDVIYAANFWYNTSKTETKFVDSAAGTEAAAAAIQSLTPETFMWKVGIVPENELVLTYSVYLEGSMEGLRPAGTYDTNTHAELNYVNYLGNDCELVVPTPKLPWDQATVGYAFYLVNENGDPIINQTTGELGSFERSVEITRPVYQDFMLNSGGQILPGRVVASEVLPEGYVLFDEAAEYTVSMNSDGTGTYSVKKGVERATTYIQGLQEEDINPVGDHEATNFATANTIVWFAVYADVRAVPDTVVIDYGLPVEIDVLGNDPMMGDYGELAYVGAPEVITDEDAYRQAAEENEDLKLWQYLVDLDIDQTAKFETTEANGKFGKAEIIKSATEANGKIRYTLNTSNGMQMKEEETFVYAVDYTGSVSTQGYYYSTVTVIPATAIYYEDSFVQYSVFDMDSNIIANDWDSDGTQTDAEQAQDRPGEYSLPEVDADNIYGYDGAYTEMAAYSMGAVKKVTVNSQQFAEAQFTFWGTGFDIISLTSNTSGTITVSVYKTSEFINADGINNYGAKPVETHMVDTYYGYQYVGGEWVVDTDAADTLYQVPVMKVSGLGYDQYTALITVWYEESLDHQGHGQYDFYLDAVRIYDPANDGEDNKVIEDAYVADGEGWPEYFELRNLIIGTETFDSLEDEAVGGIVFIDNKQNYDAGYSIADYTNFGPNNELYLAPGQAIAFNLAVPDDVSAIQLAMKSVGGTADVQYYTAAKSDGEVKTADQKTVTVATATDLYYDITSLNNKTVVIRNESGSILSITNVKVTYNSAHTDSIESSYFNTTKEDTNLAVASLMMMRPPVSDETGPEETEPAETGPVETEPEEMEPETTTPEVPDEPVFKPGKFMVRLSDSNVKVGSKVFITVYTGRDVDYITINGVKVSRYSGSRYSSTRTWKACVEAEAVGEMEIAVVCYNSEDLASEAVVKSVTVTEKYTEAIDIIRDLIIGFISRFR